MESYDYQRLAENELRLVNIIPTDKNDTPDSPVRLHLITVHIDRCPAFQVLSYTWDVDSTPVYCDGKIIQVSQNLQSALSALRKRQSLPKNFWIDAICINQADFDEKSGGIQLLPRILEQAIRTVLWVGVDGVYTDAAFGLIPKLVLARREVFQDELWSSPSQNLTQNSLKSYREMVSSSSPTGWKGLDDLMAQRMFERAWTTPDIIFSRDLSLRCGRFEASWTDLCYGLDAYACYSLSSELRHPGVQRVLGLNSLRLRRLTRHPTTPDIILEILRDLSATDQRDKIYATLWTIGSLGLRTSHDMKEQKKQKKGLDKLSWLKRIASKGLRSRSQKPTSDKEQKLVWMIPDYTKPYEDVCSDTAKALNVHDEFVTLPFCSLSMVEDSGSRRHEPNRSQLTGQSRIPSWAPDWKFPSQVYRLNNMESTFLASKGRSSGSVHFNEGGAMVFPGCVVDRVGEIASYLPPRRWYDKYNTSGANSFFFLEWIERARENVGARYERRDDRLLLDWVETIQAKGCSLWKELETRDPASLIATAKSWLRLFEEEDEVETVEIRQFHAACLPSYGRRFGITGRGKLCLMPRFAERHDLICIPFGSKVPFVFRKMENFYMNIGECYVHGSMNGETFEIEDIEEVEFVLR